MAILRGKGSMSGVELVVVEYPNARSKAGDRVFLDAQVRPVEGVAPQQVPHLVSKKRELDGRTLVSKKRELDGRTVYDHQAGYSVSQRDAIVAAAGDNFVQMPERNGHPGPRVYAVKADVMPASGKQTGLVINTKTLEPSELAIDDKIFDELRAASKAAKEANEARKAAQKDAEAEVSAEAQVEEVAEIENDEPEF